MTSTRFTKTATSSMPPSASPRRAGTRAVLAVALAGALAACGGREAGGGSGGSGEPAESVAGTAVAVVDNDFEPGHLEVPPGETVTWTWEGGREHNVVGEGFESPVQQTGTFTHTFDQPGQYDYRCTLHGGMTGSITVPE